MWWKEGRWCDGRGELRQEGEVRQRRKRGMVGMAEGEERYGRVRREA